MSIEEEIVYIGKKKRVKKSCEYCEKDVFVLPSKAKKQKIFYCNQACRTEHLKITMSGKNNPNYERLDYKCDGCEKDIKVIPSKIREQKYIFCDNDCYKKNIGRYYTGELNPNYIEKTYNCLYCNKEFERTPSTVGKNHYCSNSCYHKNRTGKHKKKVEITCSICNSKFKVWESRLKYAKHIHCSKECANIGISRRYSGENSPVWNHNLTYEERIKGRNYPEYKEWRKEVFQRDNFQCQSCGDNTGGNLVAHHILNYSEHPTLQTNVDNGITLCQPCHKLFHDTYGYTKNTLEELEDFLK